MSGMFPVASFPCMCYRTEDYHCVSVSRLFGSPLSRSIFIYEWPRLSVALTLTHTGGSGQNSAVHSSNQFRTGSALNPGITKPDAVTQDSENSAVVGSSSIDKGMRQQTGFEGLKEAQRWRCSNGSKGEVTLGVYQI